MAPEIDHQLDHQPARREFSDAVNTPRALRRSRVPITADHGSVGAISKRRLPREVLTRIVRSTGCNLA